MSFVYPQMLWIMLVPIVVFALLLSTNKDKLSRVFDQKVLDRLSVVDNTMPLMLRNILFFIAIFFMVVALARPVKDMGDKLVEVKGLSLLAAIDISGSMRSKDIYPNRLEFAKKKLLALFEQMPSDEISLLAFAHSSFVLAPFSSDKETLRKIVEGVNSSYINMSSTDFSALGRLAAKVLEKRKPKIMVVVSDGGDKKALEGFASILKEEDITLYVILVGTEKGSPVLDENGKPMTANDGSIAITQLNRDLGEIALEHGGAYVIASSGKEDIEKLVSAMRSKFNNQQQGEVKIKDQIEYFYYPLAAALFFLLLAMSSLPRRRERS